MKPRPVKKYSVVPDPAAIFNAWRQGAEAAAVNTDTPALFERFAALGLDVDDARCTQSELCWKRAGDQREAADKAGIQNAAKSRDAVRKNDSVDAVLDVGMLIAHMDFAAGSGVLRDAGRLQQHFVDWRLGTLRQRVDCRAIDVEGAGTEIAAIDYRAPRRISYSWKQGRCSALQVWAG